MEEKLRNLSQNIAANTGDEHQPKHPHPEDDTPKEEEHHEEEPREEEPREEEHHEEEISDYTPEPESEEHQDDSEKARPETVSRNPHEDFEESEPRDDGSERTGSKDERFGDEATEEPKILTMDTEEEPQESPTRTKKYSPEVEAALNRLNTDDAAVDLSEPLSTEPKKKHHDAHIFLFILFVLAIAAVSLCILVEQKIIDNPFPDIFNKAESSQTAPANTNKADTKAKTDTDTKTDTETTEPTRGSADSTTNTEEKQ